MSSSRIEKRVNKQSILDWWTLEIKERCIEMDIECLIYNTQTGGLEDISTSKEYTKIDSLYNRVYDKFTGEEFNPLSIIPEFKLIWWTILTPTQKTVLVRECDDPFIDPDKNWQDVNLLFDMFYEITPQQQSAERLVTNIRYHLKQLDANLVSLMKIEGGEGQTMCNGGVTYSFNNNASDKSILEKRLFPKHTFQYKIIKNY